MILSKRAKKKRRQAQQAERLISRQLEQLAAQYGMGGDDERPLSDTSSDGGSGGGSESGSESESESESESGDGDGGRDGVRDGVRDRGRDRSRDGYSILYNSVRL